MANKISRTLDVSLTISPNTCIVSGLGVTVAEEVALKWYEMVQTGLPMCALSSIFGPIPLPLADKRFLLSRQVPWGLACGKDSTFFMNIYFEKELEKDVNKLRRKYRISLAPRRADIH